MLISLSARWQLPCTLLCEGILIDNVVMPEIARWHKVELSFDALVKWCIISSGLLRAVDVRLCPAKVFGRNLRRGLEPRLRELLQIGGMLKGSNVFNCKL